MGWKEDFLYKMFVEKDTKNGLQLYVENQPETIFRYRQGNENDINALKNNQIWLSNMKCVNDKFEGQLEISYDNMNLNFSFLHPKHEIQPVYFSNWNKSKRSTTAPADIAPFDASVIKVSVFQPFRGPALTATIFLPMYCSF